MLPYWNSDLDLEIASWFPLGVDYQPVSINHLYSSRLRRIAASCLALESEFLFVASPQLGCVGGLMRDNFYRAEPYGLVSFGFMLLLSYSPRMEKLVSALLAAQTGVAGGIALCSLWEREAMVGRVKAIALVSEDPFFDEKPFLKGFDEVLVAAAKKRGGVSFFAERFGYWRFSMPHETDDPLQLRISQLLYEMEFPETRQMVGPSPEVPFPPFFGFAIGFGEENPLGLIKP